MKWETPVSNDICQQLVDRGLISQDQLGEAEGMASSLGIRTEDALVKLEYVDASEISTAQAHSLATKRLI